MANTNKGTILKLLVMVDGLPDEYTLFSESVDIEIECYINKKYASTVQRVKKSEMIIEEEDPNSAYVIVNTNGMSKGKLCAIAKVAYNDTQFRAVDVLQKNEYAPYDPESPEGKVVAMLTDGLNFVITDQTASTPIEVNCALKEDDVVSIIVGDVKKEITVTEEGEEFEYSDLNLKGRVELDKITFEAIDTDQLYDNPIDFTVELSREPDAALIIRENFEVTIEPQINIIDPEE